MHMADKNTPYILYLFTLSPIIPYPCLLWVGEGEETNTLTFFPLHLEMPQAIYKAENSMTLKIHLEYVRICVSQQILYI